MENILFEEGQKNSPSTFKYTWDEMILHIRIGDTLDDHIVKSKDFFWLDDKLLVNVVTDKMTYQSKESVTWAGPLQALIQIGDTFHGVVVTRKYYYNMGDDTFLPSAG